MLVVVRVFFLDQIVFWDSECFCKIKFPPKRDVLATSSLNNRRGPRRGRELEVEDTEDEKLILYRM